MPCTLVSCTVLPSGSSSVRVVTVVPVVDIFGVVDLFGSKCPEGLETPP